MMKYMHVLHENPVSKFRLHNKKKIFKDSRVIES